VPDLPVPILDMGLRIWDWKNTLTPVRVSALRLSGKKLLKTRSLPFAFLYCVRPVKKLLKTRSLPFAFLHCARPVKKLLKNIHFFVYSIGKMGIKGCMLVGWTFGAKVPS
jgi:hypothetical protein